MPDELKRDSFAFFRSFREAIEMLPERQQLTAFKAVADYALDGVEPSTDFAETMFWKLVKPGLNKSRTKARGGSASGGPRPSMRGNQNAVQHKNNTETTQKQHIPSLPNLTSPTTTEEPKSTEAEVPVEKNNPKSEVPKPKPEVTTIEPARVKPAAKPPSPSGTSGHRTSVEISSIESLRPKGEKWAEDYEDPVDFALAVTGEPNTLQARYCYGSYLRDLGPSEFTEVVRTFQAEVRAGEVPRNIAACLNARLKDRRAVLLSLRKADADRASKTA